MAMYLGSNKYKINLDGKIYNLNLYTKTIITDSVLLLTSDGSILKTLNNLYLTVKEDK